MAELSRKEFAALCRTTQSIIRSNISRKKIIEVDGIIDTKDPLNKMFFDKYLALAEEKDLKKKIKGGIEDLYDDVVEKAADKITKKTATTKRKNSRAKSQKIVDWDARKKRADTLLQERKAEKEQLNLEKLAGKLIPVDLVFQILRIHNHDIFATFQNDAENLASVYCDILAGGDRKKLSEITTKLSEKLDDAVRRAREVSMSSIESAVEDYTETRNRGERK